MPPIIEIHKLGKKYTVAEAKRYLALRDIVSEKFKNLFRRKQPGVNEFWALQNINLEIEQGQRVGIIGRNGAGKSTLLKILSKITPPTTGEIKLRGRVASLLEVGTGFHPELTGRENIYLNGSILGLTRKEIDRKLEEIIDFSGVEKFIDTPLKHYSSGMQLRLAFSVAAHLEPEILLIDEVLAVGDIEFQKKCIGKMEEISNQTNRTIVFVSHNMAAIKQLCTQAVVIQSGEIAFSGNVDESVSFYTTGLLALGKKTGFAQYDLTHHPNKAGKDIGILSARLFVDNEASETFLPGQTMRIEIDYFLPNHLIDPEVGIVIKDENENSLIGLNNKHLGKKMDLRTNQLSKAAIILPQMNLFKPCKYRVDLYFGDGVHFYECLYNAFEFTVTENDVYNSGVALNPQWNSIFIPNLDIVAE